MNNKSTISIAVFFIALILIANPLTSPIYIVKEGTQAIVTQFGEPIGNPIIKAGLHLKIPFIQKINYFEKRILAWDGDSNQIPTKDKRYIWVDTTARWRIKDPLKFFQSVANEIGAHARLDDIIDSAVR
ncbi:MAG: SPFH domain-containing protein, partial [Candidatus Omnitrophota bacterium]